MPPSGKVVSVADISAKEFEDLLARYPSVLQSISDGKAAKNGQKTLAELDQYRYVEAPECFRLDRPKRPMNQDDVKALVEWKLRHGKFRPSLMKLVSSNDRNTIKDIIENAINVYRKKPETSASIDMLCKLKGIGPATASLLLSVHDSERVLFFSDEAFYWLCCNGKKDAIKYSKKEYAALNEEAQKLIKRLGIKAMDLEKVAYVVINGSTGESGSKIEKEKLPNSKSSKEEVKHPTSNKSSSGKRKQDSDEDNELVAAPPRRSKRNRPG
ncbi:hypothetical protein jhhlp_005174 [Lomentospora prolificans]|uniref:Uncharacterized protein n=1 Tax=Lomentospora prolificans TaxID=41688 RepID=A0A2N3N778_9PEZI|nr:hypothetical protein jhhlp_005174 [Lomentospora prolificans]